MRPHSVVCVAPTATGTTTASVRLLFPDTDLPPSSNASIGLYPPPIVSSVHPRAGPSEGSTPLTVAGRFGPEALAADSARCRFGDGVGAIETAAEWNHSATWNGTAAPWIGGGGTTWNGGAATWEDL